jgi:mono/diheme cytochrome c family protein
MMTNGSLPVSAPSLFRPFTWPRRWAQVSLGALFLGLSLLAAAPRASADEALRYNRDIRPILANNCFACHGADSAAREADLRLDKRDVAMAIEAIVPGKPDKSKLVGRIFSSDPDMAMPPAETKKKLTAAEKETLKRWIAEGAEYEPHWSFVAPQRPEPPAVKNPAWAKNAIDYFVLAKLEDRKLAPAPEADARTLFRRLHLDITGLPPPPGDVEAFAAGYARRGDAAVSEWIDKLMQTTAWGEHRARYWLDAARYGDTHGLHFDNYREMWPYRDWVIRSFTANQPFDQFTIEQIAGDLLPSPTDDQLVATGFQRCNITTNEGGTIDEENLAIYAVDRVQTFGWVYLGLTTNCAQCHDHKFDPISMKDHYALAAYFRNTTQPAKDGNVKDGRGPVLMVPRTADLPRWRALPDEIAAAKARQDDRRKNARGDFDKWLAEARPDALKAGAAGEGLVAHVPLDEGAGNEAHNLCAGPEKFPATGDVTWSPDGKFGPAPVMKRGGTFDLGELGDFEKDQPFSYGAWIKAGRVGVYGGIIARMDEKADYRGWDLWQNDSAVAVHIIDAWPDNGLKVITKAQVLKPGQWQHVFATYDGSRQPGGVKIYVDGKEEPLTVERNTLKADASIRTKTPLRIGQRSETQVFDGGAVQDVRVYDRTLPAAEVQAIAEKAALRAILAVESSKRTPAQQAALFEHYLVTRDEAYPSLVKAVADLEAEREAIKARSPITHIQTERKDSMPTAHVLMRGDYDKPGEKVEAAPPAALHAPPKDAPKSRLGLALWTVDPANPLTARVTVNRFWQEVFGQGLVVTAEDFGTMGALPSHPELLDWLAVEFRESGWDVKRFFKLVLTSATYRQAAVTTPEKHEKDRDNALLSRGPRFRMDAEMVRDHALAASGLLSRTMYGAPAKPYQPEDIWNIVGLPGGDTRNYVQDKGENLYRRTVYSFWKRMAPPPNLDAFNAPSREVCAVRRERTNTPLQALVTLNDPQFVEAARALAQNAIMAAKDDKAILDHIALGVLARPMNDREAAILLADKGDFLAHYQSQPDDAKALVAVGDSKADEKLDVPLLAAWTIVCNQVMNLDEALNK